MDLDDIQVGRILSRREVFALLGAGSALALVGCGDDDGAEPTATAASATDSPATVVPTGEPTPLESPTGVVDCVVRPELTEGPYFVDERLDRSDVRPDSTTGEVRDGIEFRLDVNVYDVSAGICAPLAGAVVDIWHCDAEGDYSDATDPGFNTVGQDWLRGYQLTDAAGNAGFVTIYPGWYPGRAVHIHFKIRTDFDGGREFTSQWFFDESITDDVHAREPYAAKGYRTILNEDDGIYQQSRGELTLAPEESAGVYSATFNLGVDLS